MKDYIIIFIVSINFSAISYCQSLSWYGLGTGDAYLEIQDSVLTYNLLDHYPGRCEIEAISADSILCGFYDWVKGEFKYNMSFAHSNNFKTIDLGLDTKFYNDLNEKDFVFNEIDSLNLISKHNIDSVVLTIYNYDGFLEEKIEIAKNGEIRIGIQNEFSFRNKKEEAEDIIQMLEILDLENIYNSRKNYFEASHLPNYCLQIKYDATSQLQYCRQQHNKYFEKVISKIMELEC